MVNAIILINAKQGQIETVAKALMAMDGVSEVYSVAGRYDIVAIVRVKEHEQLARLIADAIQKTSGLDRTETLIAFRAYSRHDLESMFGLGLE